jgi:threonine aldolase
MRRAISEAPLGDDQYGEDPTTRRLEALAADKVGKEASLLVLSGTMGNLVAALTHAQPGDEVILDVHSHCYNAEVGGLARLGGLMSRQLDGGRDGLDPAEVERAIRPAVSTHRPKTGLIMIENTSNRGAAASSRWPALRRWPTWPRGTICRSTWMARESSTPPWRSASTSGRSPGTSTRSSSA